MKRQIHTNEEADRDDLLFAYCVCSNLLLHFIRCLKQRQSERDIQVDKCVNLQDRTKEYIIIVDSILVCVCMCTYTCICVRVCVCWGNENGTSTKQQSQIE